MYSKSFYIEGNVWNNALSFSKRIDPKLFVPEFKKIENYNQIKLLEKNPERITFQDFWFDGKLQTCYGLENFYEINWGNKKIYLFDNHNHAYYFWYLARSKWIVWDGAVLYHVDEHADYRDPWNYLLKPDSQDLEKVCKYVNFSDINVWNYIIPAEKEGLVSKTIQIRNTQNLEDYFKKTYLLEKKEGIILNLDLDFFQPDLDFIDYDLKKKVVLDIAKKADVITVASSPFFIEQEWALRVFKDLFYK